MARKIVPEDNRQHVLDMVFPRKVTQHEQSMMEKEMPSWLYGMAIEFIDDKKADIFITAGSQMLPHNEDQRRMEIEGIEDQVIGMVMHVAESIDVDLIIVENYNKQCELAPDLKRTR